MKLILVVFCCLISLTSCGEATSDSSANSATNDKSSQTPNSFSAIVREPKPYVDVQTTFRTLNGADKEAFPLRARPGGLLLVYFGYTSCPDICPTTLADIRDALGVLGDDSSKITFAMFGIDFANDTPDVLDKYVKSFLPNNGSAMVANSPEELVTIGKPFLATWAVTDNDKGSTDVQHSAFLYGVDDQGMLVATWPWTTGGNQANQFKYDFQFLLNR